MRILDVQQGSAEWLEARTKYRCASEAPVVMGVSTRTSRAELVRMKAIGNEKEFSDYVRDLVLNRGHEVEGPAIGLLEARIGESLFPATAVDDSGVYLASFDGITMGEDRSAEVKLRNQQNWTLAQRGEIPEEHIWQMEHQALVGNLPLLNFIVSDGTEEGTLILEYVPQPGRRAKLIAAWDQFDADVAAYQHVEVLPAPPAQQATLPALSIRVDGKLALTSNLDLFGEQLRAFIKSIPTKPESDQDFADCEAAVKTLERAETALKAAEDSALAQTASVEEMRRTVATYNELARTNRLMIEKLVKARKEAIRAEIVQGGKDELAKHLVLLTDRLGADYLPVIPSDFAGVVKGKKTVASLRDAVSGELARVKLAANEVADRIQVNLRMIKKLAASERHQFPDMRQIVLKAPDDCEAFVKNRLAENKAAAERKEAEQRALIEAEVRQKVEAEQAAAAKAAADAVARASEGIPVPPYVARTATEPVRELATAGAAPMTQMEREVNPEVKVTPRPFLQNLLATAQPMEITQIDERTYLLKIL